jgi:hypothetical protein
MEEYTVSDFLKFIKNFDVLLVEGVMIKSHCIFENDESDMFLWISLNDSIFIKFYHKNNLIVNYSSSQKCWHIKDEYDISYRIDPKLLKIKN